MLRLAILSGLLAIATVTWGQEAVGPVGAVLTLEQAVALALQNNRQVQNASLEVGKKIDQAAAARTSRLPAFNMYFLFFKQLVVKEGSCIWGSQKHQGATGQAPQRAVGESRWGTGPGNPPIPAR
jgi:outer membrane protein TolC